MAAVEIRGLTKRFGAVEAVKDLSFDVEAGRVTGFLGPNGAGKSTTLRALLGLIRPTAGSATFGGTPYEQLDAPSSQVGAVLEDASFHPGRSGRNHLRVLATAGEHPRTARRRAARARGPDRRGRPAGQGVLDGHAPTARHRRALLGDPDVLILDEPANGLDPPGIRWLRDLMRAQARAGRAVLVSSHLLAEMAQSADKIVVIARGALRAQGSLSEVLGGGGESVIAVRSPDAARLAEALGRRGLRAERVSDDELEVPGATAEVVGRAAAEEGVVVLGLSERLRSLEDAFFALTGQDS